MGQEGGKRVKQRRLGMRILHLRQERCGGKLEDERRSFTDRYPRYRSYNEARLRAPAAGDGGGGLC
jgi:hypothetical protein